MGVNQVVLAVLAWRGCQSVKWDCSHLPPSLDQEVLETAGISLTPAELHGALCGALSVGGVPAALEWLAASALASEGAPADFEQEAESLRALVLATWQSLASDEMAFQPLLPGDDEMLEARVAALAFWCHGFLVGLDAAGVKLDQIEALPEPLREVVTDFSAVARAVVGPSDAEQGEESEFALLELTEYVRVGALLVFEELEPVRSVPRVPTNTH
jgi:uncharacterized protein